MSETTLDGSTAQFRPSRFLGSHAEKPAEQVVPAGSTANRVAKVRRFDQSSHRFAATIRWTIERREIRWSMA
jgi:hypothetical protein